MNKSREKTLASREKMIKLAKRFAIWQQAHCAISCGSNRHNSESHRKATIQTKKARKDRADWPCKRRIVACEVGIIVANLFGD